MSNTQINFEEEVKLHYNYLYNVASYYLNDKHLAYDALQDSLIKAYNNLNKFKFNSSYKTYLTRIIINTCYDYMRKNKINTVELNENIIIKAKDNPHSDLELNEQSAYLYDAINKLKPKYREIIILKDIQDLSYDEISQVLGISLSSVKTRIHRARNNLRDILSNGGMEL